MLVATPRPETTDAEKISNNLVSAVTGMERPVVIPLTFSPIAITPVSAGASCTAAPGIAVNWLLEDEALYSCAVILTVVPIKLIPASTLKYAAKEFIVPFLGMENAKLLILVVSIIPLIIRIPVAELPKPTAAVVPTNPPSIVVNATTLPDA